MLSTEDVLFVEAEEHMQRLWSEIDIYGPILPFHYTRYYEKEMGANLLRKFVSFAKLINPGELARIKHEGNALEAVFSESEGLRLNVGRPINLDPGYIEPSKLVLATTKNYSHRIYIGDDMYAETTLHYHQGRWQSWPFTYPDYASGDYNEFLSAARNRLLEQLSSQS